MATIINIAPPPTIWIALEEASSPNAYPSITIAVFQMALERKIIGINHFNSIFAIPAGMDMYCPKPKLRGARNTETLPYFSKNLFSFLVFEGAINLFYIKLDR